MKNELLLISGADIPFVEGRLIIHQPTLYEISLIGEEAFFSGCELLKFSKDVLETKDQEQVKQYTEFQIVSQMAREGSGAQGDKTIYYMSLVLDLLFPDYEREWTPFELRFTHRENAEITGFINDTNFLIFKDIIKSMFCTSQTADETYNVQGDLAKKIADKFKKRKQQLASLSPKTENIAVFSRYISILAVGEKKDINSLTHYTVYQLMDEFQRYQLKVGYDLFVKMQLAGASDLETPEDWMKNIH